MTLILSSVFAEMLIPAKTNIENYKTPRSCGTINDITMIYLPNATHRGGFSLLLSRWEPRRYPDDIFLLIKKK